MFRYLIVVLLIMTFALLYSCNTVEEKPNYTYSIVKVWWSDSLDSNLDGYAQFKRLNFDVHLTQNVTRIINARIYYKLNTASNFSFYAFSGDKLIQGKNKDNNIFVPIGLPNPELERGKYDFSIEIYEKDSDKLKARTDSVENKILSNKKFEKSSSDKSYSITPHWSNIYDGNGNGYWRYARLNLDVNIDDNVTRTVTAKIYYKESSVDTFALYHTIPNFTITDHSSSDTVSYVIGSPTTTLDHGIYDFRVNLYEAKNNMLVAFIDQYTNPNNLKDKKFESEDEDSYYYSIPHVWWSNQVDLDSDSYTSFRKLHFDVDVDKNVQRTIFAKIFVKADTTNEPDTLDYSLYDSTANFNITGSNTNDAYSIPVGFPNQLDSNKYDIMISIYDAQVKDTLQKVETSISGMQDSILAYQKFETAKQDSLKKP